jgi:murein DD-endopeptidase MepM/ murein hydrolase activator NlpD
MRARAATALVVALLSAVAGTAAGDPGNDYQEKQQVDARIDALRGEIAQAKTREGVLTSQLSAVNDELRLARARVAEQEAKLSGLEGELWSARERLRVATGVVRAKTDFLRFVQRQESIARYRLAERLRDLYKHDRPDALSVLLAARSFSQLLDDVDYSRRLGQQDRKVQDAVVRARVAAARARLDASRARARAAALERDLAGRVREAAAARDRLAATRDTVEAARSVKAEAVASAREDKQAYLDEARALEAQSAALAARIRTAQASSGYRPSGGSPGALSWPVSGPVTSPFGMRWGRMHEGIDIAVPLGSAVHAAAAGRVVYAGWLGGYGNLVVLDHGGGLSTAYGHNTSIAVSVGQDVAAGDVIASSGSTGHSTGPHVHFEVRVNGAPVDPLGYL